MIRSCYSDVKQHIINDQVSRYELPSITRAMAVNLPGPSSFIIKIE